MFKNSFYKNYFVNFVVSNEQWLNLSEVTQSHDLGTYIHVKIKVIEAGISVQYIYRISIFDFH